MVLVGLCILGPWYSAWNISGIDKNVLINTSTVSHIGYCVCFRICFLYYTEFLKVRVCIFFIILTPILKTITDTK